MYYCYNIIIFAISNKNNNTIIFKSIILVRIIITFTYKNSYIFINIICININIRYINVSFAIAKVANCTDINSNVIGQGNWLFNWCSSWWLFTNYYINIETFWCSSRCALNCFYCIIFGLLG